MVEEQRRAVEAMEEAADARRSESKSQKFFLIPSVDLFVKPDRVFISAFISQHH